MNITTETLVDLLLKTTNEKKGVTKLNELIEVLFEEELNDYKLSTIRFDLLFWLYSCSVLSYEEASAGYKLHEPKWYPNAVNIDGKIQYTLFGALSREEHEKMQPYVEKGSVISTKNSISTRWKKKLELPRTYLTYDGDVMNATKFAISSNSIFSDLLNDKMVNPIREENRNIELKKGKASFTEEMTWLIGNDSDLLLYGSHKIEKYDWLEGYFNRSSLQEFTEDKEPEHLRLFRITEENKDRNEEVFYRNSYFAIVELNKEDGEYYSTIYLDTSKDKWIIFEFYSRLKFYSNISSDFNLSQQDVIKKLKNSDSSLTSNNQCDAFNKCVVDLNNESHPAFTIGIPKICISQYMKYDNYSGFGQLLISRRLLLPKEIMRQLIACSGELPTTVQYPFYVDPRFFTNKILNEEIGEYYQSRASDQRALFFKYIPIEILSSLDNLINFEHQIVAFPKRSQNKAKLS
jgi:hypothetical protein